MKKNLLVILMSCLCFATQAQEIKLPPFITNDLNSYIKKGMQDWQIPGMAVAIVKDDKVILCKGYGVREFGEKDSVNERTLFMIGSNTKAFTATALTILQAEKKVSLNNKVKEWMPGFELKNKLASQEVTITDLLCHRIGFETFQGDFTYWSSNLSRADIIRKMSLIDAVYDFRTKWGYCNAAFVTAGELIPRICGNSWEETVREKILLPLKMNHTRLSITELKLSLNAAVAHTLVNDTLLKIPYPEIDNLGAAGSISSNVEDMSHWLLAQLNEGEYNGTQVINKEAILAIRKPSSILGVNTRFKQASHFALYGLGLEVSDRAGKVVYSHEGGVDGFVSSVMFIPEENVGIVIVTNTDQNNFYQDLTNEIRDAFLGLPFMDFSGKSLNYFKKKQEEAKAWQDSINKLIAIKNKPRLSLTEYTGIYTNTVYGTIEVKQEKNNLAIYFSNHPTLVGNLQHINNDIFLCTYSNPTMGIKEIPFKIENGKVTGLTLRVADFVEFLPYEFAKTTEK